MIDFDGEKNKPKWDSGLGYLILIDQTIKLANNFLINAEWPQYYRTLEAWYITSKYWLEQSKKIKNLKLKHYDKNQNEIEIPALEKLEMLRKSASEDQIGVLKKYHELLDYLSSTAGLRLASSGKGIPGVIDT